MQSSMCRGGEHEVCGKHLQVPSGKKFKCSCDCHKPAVVFSELTDDDLIAEQEILSGTNRG